MTDLPLAFVIEDDEDQNMIFTTALQRAGFQTESFLEGLVAQKRLTEAIPDMVVLDLHIPGVNGNVILAQVRADRRLENARVILTTADAEFASSLRSQVDLVLLKPISFSQLSQLASRFIKLK